MNKFNKLFLVLILIVVLLIIFSFIAPSIFTGKIFFSDTGQIGDTIGGLMNLFIAIAGVIVTSLAFYIQYLANKIQVENFEKTQKDPKADTSGLEEEIDRLVYEVYGLNEEEIKMVEN